jgi:hypothetical protein
MYNIFDMVSILHDIAFMSNIFYIIVRKDIEKSC